MALEPLMAEGLRNILICSCDDTMPLDERAVKRACRGAEVIGAHQLCRLELETFRKAAAAGGPLTVACTQEAPLFSEVADEGADIRFVNIRETAGWSKDAKAAGPKMAALIAAAAEPTAEHPVRELRQRGRDPDLRPRRSRDRDRRTCSRTISTSPC